MNWTAYEKPKSVSEVLTVLEQAKGIGRVIAGGTDLILQLRQGKKVADLLVDITEIDELKQIEEEDGWIRIGAAVTHAEVAKSDLIQREAMALAQGCVQVGSPQIRNVATLVGNVVSAQPAGDGAIPLMALDAEIKVASKAGERSVPLEEAYRGIGLSSIDACSEVAMGLGYTLMEEVLLEHGMIRNPRFSEYLLPTSLDMPETVSHLVEVPEATGPFGAKGIGEPALIPTAPAILNAIGAAAGIRVKDLPATPEALWRLLNPLPEKKINNGSEKD